MGAQIHWFSIFNSFMMVIFLTGLVSMILMRTLRADYARYTARDDDDLEALERDVGEESGCVPSLPEGSLKMATIEIFALTSLEWILCL